MENWKWSDDIEIFECNELVNGINLIKTATEDELYLSWKNDKTGNIKIG